ncbi:LysR family transcriptional regulator [Terrarubrum flagellatum]|uniref:LysR family transcriptional regulator n=1 Tax=Terrirubrum flagellatum TaxID=2895980 RepID=UPI003144FE76
MHAAVLRYFLQVARDGSIRGAAERLNVASSAVNRQILRLEDELGVTLFERVRNGVRLTDAGQILLVHIRQTFADFDRAKAEIANISGGLTGHVRIVCLESLAVRFMPEVVGELAAAHPGLTLSVIVVDPNQGPEELRAGRADFGILFVDRRHRDIDVRESFITAIGAVMRPDHPLARRKLLTLTDCADYPVLTLHDRWLIDAIMATEFARSGATFNARIISNSIDLMRQMILAGLGIGFFTPIGFLEEIARKELAHVPLAEPWLTDSEVGILTPRGKQLSAQARVALEFVQGKLRKLGGRLPPAVIVGRVRRITRQKK